MPGASEAPDIIRTAGFEGPLDLLLHLIERHRIDIYDIPVSQITDQYLTYLQGMLSMDLEIASEFLVMASTLLHIKSRMLLPTRETAAEDPEADPREELVIRLLEYRRCRAIAEDLRAAYDRFSPCIGRLPELPVNLGLDPVRLDAPVHRDAFFEACESVSARNRIRFNDLSARMTHILRREKVSLRDKVRYIWRRIVSRTTLLFHELFPPQTTTRTDRVTGFLALLELLKLNKVHVTQDRPFDVILVSSADGSPDPEDEDLKHFLADGRNDRADYL
ncbi:MAG: segregation/condensation protein A [Clostridia bacterium]|nr:segregation/condensation protein A [Clostridia bacterium]